MSIFQGPISSTVWDLKYRYKQNAAVIDQTIEDTWRRVAKAAAQPEQGSQAAWAARFYHLLEDFRYLPGGRILAGAGTTHHVTLFNCFVMDIPEDSLSSIFSSLREGALTLQQGGGVGYDFSVLRPKGDMAKKTGIPSSGPISFMRIWDTTCGVLLSTGARRGAMMAVLRCDHPDIEEFIAAKEDARELRHFNVSVLVTDDFMRAVKNDSDWPLIFPVESQSELSDTIIYRNWNGREAVPCRLYRYIKARQLWEKIIRAAYEYAEPGVLFEDTINRMNPLWYREYIHATNPCGEIPLPAYGACNLGAINLTQFVSSAFTANANINWAALEEVVRAATRFQDNIIDISHYPLPIQREQAFGTRRIGLGITGLADVFVMLGIRYGSKESVALAGRLMKKIADTTWFTSIELAKEKSPFPFYNKNYLQGEFVSGLDEGIKRLLAQYGIRNSHHNTIAPTGTISLLANNISNGIEPIFSAAYERHMRMPEGNLKTFQIEDYAWKCWCAAKQNASLPPAWVDANSLSPDAHLQVQAAIQPFIDNAISKTINIPSNFPFVELADIYTRAHALGLKGCTIFRPNVITGSVLQVKECETSEVGNCCPGE